MSGVFEFVYESWRDSALCAQVDWDLFFPDRGGKSGRIAKRICDRCPVKQECLQWSLDHDVHYGVWGGLSETQRRQLREQKKAA